MPKREGGERFGGGGGRGGEMRRDRVREHPDPLNSQAMALSQLLPMGYIARAHAA